jgi:hypothetical protein
MQTRTGAAITSDGAGVTRSDTGLILGIFHDRLPWI